MGRCVRIMKTPWDLLPRSFPSIFVLFIPCSLVTEPEISGYLNNTFIRRRYFVFGFTMTQTTVQRIRSNEINQKKKVNFNGDG